MTSDASILWRRRDRPGHEYARVTRGERGWLLSGVALFAHEGLPCRLDYSVTCDPSWLTTEAEVAGWVGEQRIQVRITADGDGSWKMNGISCPDVRDCLDVDLNFTPSTNLLPIRRLALAVGQRSEVHAAWLRFPDFTLRRLDQIYTRVAERRYRYESADGTFATEIQVDDIGLPVSYGNIWTSERF